MSSITLGGGYPPESESSSDSEYAPSITSTWGRSTTKMNAEVHELNSRVRSDELDLEVRQSAIKTNDIGKLILGAAMMIAVPVGVMFLMGTMAFPPAGAAVLILALIASVTIANVLIFQGFQGMDEASKKEASPLFYACKALYESNKEKDFEKFLQQVYFNKNPNRSPFSRAIDDGHIEVQDPEAHNYLIEKTQEYMDTKDENKKFTLLIEIKEKMKNKKFKDIYKATPPKAHTSSRDLENKAYRGPY